MWGNKPGAVNDSSEVVGTLPDSTYFLCFYWKDGVTTILPTLGGPSNTRAMDINNSSVIVGGSELPPRLCEMPVRWVGGSIATLTQDPMFYNGLAYGINSQGVIVGTIVDTTHGDPQHPFIYDGILSTVNSGPANTFIKINDSGYILYSLGLYFNGSWTDLGGALGCYDMNNRNQIVGSTQGGAFLWENGTTVLLGGSLATAINDNEIIVGYYYNYPEIKAVVWINRVMRNLNTLIPQSSGITLLYALDVNNKGEILCIGQPAGTSLYYYYLLEPDQAVVIRDAKNDTIPNVEFNLIRVANDPPFFTEDTLGSFTTDGDGRLGLTELAVDTFTVELSTGTKKLVIGDSLKIAKHVHSVPAAKHERVLGTMYSVHLDNAHFAEDGQMHFDRFTGPGQEIVLNHTELRYNLLVSVGWEATESYLKSLEDNFRFMSNYLYDVSDGQLRLDTVYIIDNGAFSGAADIIVYASNFVWPCANAGGILSGGAKHIYMPRIWMGDSTESRNYTDRVYPLNLNAYSMDYRTKAHEFGHYALSFFDEYLFKDILPFVYTANDALRCLPRTIFNYGFMDRPYEWAGVMSSEMSGAFRYEMASCQNTQQWGVHGMSCWDHLERWVEAVPWGTDNLYVPILKPSLSDENERIVTEPGVFFAGPNNNMARLDYHVGYLMAFPNSPSPQAPGYSDKHVTVRHPRGGENASLRLINDPETSERTTIYEGRTSDAAGAWVVGVKDASYQILVSKGRGGDQPLPMPSLASPGAVTTDWLYGIAESGGPGVSRLGNRFASTSAGDSVTIDLKEVQGYYPLICSAELLDNGVRYGLFTLQPFVADPSLELWPSYGGMYSHTFGVTGTAYEVTIVDSLGANGLFNLWAMDDSAATFFVPTRYITMDISHDQPLLWLLGPDGQSEFKLDSANTSLERTLILSSPYPVVRTGLDPNAVQAGQVHSLSVYPTNPLSGANQVVLRYDDADLKLGDNLLGDEAALAVYHWVDGSTGWVMIGGTVDTAANAIYTSITETGVYAAFTTNIITDVQEDERGDILPFNFELSQNYPNPFNPVTTIEFSIPTQSQVKIEVFNVQGQKVRTLVNEAKSAGSYRIEWNGVDDAGRPVSTGIYLYRFQSGDVVQTKKMLLLK
jgi:uncharacterized membrane protein